MDKFSTTLSTHFTIPACQQIYNETLKHEDWVKLVYLISKKNIIEVIILAE